MIVHIYQKWSERQQKICRPAALRLIAAMTAGPRFAGTQKNHKLCRQELGIRSTVIATGDRYYKGGPLKGRYHNQMKKRFPKRKYRQRWQIESVFSRFKRRLGYALRSRSKQSRATECLLRVLTYNLMILYLLFKKSLINAKSN